MRGLTSFVFLEELLLEFSAVADELILLSSPDIFIMRRYYLNMQSKKGTPPSAAGPAGAEFEVKVGASYLLSMLADAPARGIAGSVIQQVSFQQGDDGYPMDDVIVTAAGPTGKPITLEIQAKRSITFSPKDPVFEKVMSQVADSVRMKGFWKRDAQLAVAALQTSRQISGPYQEILSWARETDSEKTFFARLNRKGTASNDMQSFVSTFRKHLSTFGAKHKDHDVWCLLRRFQILIFDFSKAGGAEDYWSIERARGLLAEQERNRASSLCSSIIEIGLKLDAVGGICNREALLKKLSVEGFELEAKWGTRAALKNLAEASGFAIDDVSDSIQNISIARHTRLEAVHAALSQGRYLEIQGGSGVGKSAILKRYVSQTMNSRSIVFLSPNRTTAGGWQSFRHHLEFSGNAKEFLTELCASGSPILCIDNLDFFSENEKATVKDLVRAAKDVLGLQIVATCRTRHEHDEPNWLPENILDELGRTPVITIGELSNEEVDELTAENPKLSALLSENHPAKHVARNLFRLSKLASLNPSEVCIRTEVDLAKLWWCTGDGERDSDYRDRQRFLRGMAQHSIESNELYSSINYSSRIIEQLIRSETLVDYGNDQVSFRHDVMREWSMACLFDSQPKDLEAIELSKAGSKSLLRSYELQTQMMLENGDKASWVDRLQTLSNERVHTSWFRAAFLAIVHSEASNQLLKNMTAELLADDAIISRQLIPLVIASESQSLKELFPEYGVEREKIPEGVYAPKNASWNRLVVWLLQLDKIPDRLIPAAADIMSNWMIGLFGYAYNAEAILMCFFNWLTEIETAQYPKSYQDRFKPFGDRLSNDQLEGLEGKLRMYLCIFADKAPIVATKYLKSVIGGNLPDYIVAEILKTNGTLAKAAPNELSILTKDALITNKPTGTKYQEYRDNGVSDIDLKFMPESPAQGPFFALLTNAPDVGLKLIDELVNHVIRFQIDKWGTDHNVIIVPFNKGTRYFRYSKSFYWSRRSENHSITSALMALEAWGHKRIENGDMPLQVTQDILRADFPSVAVLTVAIDVLLSSNKTTFEDIMPFLASPELVAMDRGRPDIRDSVDLDPFGLALLQKEPLGEVSKSYLKGKASRQTSLESIIPQFTFRAGKDIRKVLSKKLTAASNRLGKPKLGVDFGDPKLMALNLLCQLDLDNYTKEERASREGKTTEVMAFKAPPELSHYTEFLGESLKASLLRIKENNIVMEAGSIVEDPSTGTTEFAAKAAGVAILKNPGDKEARDFIAAAAVLILRDGDVELRAKSGDWAVKKLSEFGKQDDDYYGGIHSYLRYNRASLALYGLICALTAPLSDKQLRPIFITVKKHRHVITKGLSKSLEKLTAVDPRVLKSIIRIAISGCISPWRGYSDETEYEARKNRSDARLDKTIEAEIYWLLHDASEPSWPTLPPTEPKIRHGIRIGKKPALESDRNLTTELYEIVPNPDHLLFDDSSAAHIIMATKPIERSNWLLGFLDAFWPFTHTKNGAEVGGERIDPPREWNDCYYALLAEGLSPLDKQQALSLLKNRLISLPNESYISAVSPFLQQLDDMTFGNLTMSIEQNVEFREVIAERMMATNDWRWLAGNTSSSMSIDFRPAISNLFFNTVNAFQAPESRLTELGVQQLDPAIPLLVKCISGAPSYAVTVFTMNLVEVQFRASHKPMVLALAMSCLQNGIVEREFWVGNNFGARICAYFDKLLCTVLGREHAEVLSQELDYIVNQFILIGIPEAQRLHDSLMNEIRGSH